MTASEAAERGVAPQPDPHRFIRQQDICSPLELAPVTLHVIGGGAVGGQAALYLAKMGVGTIHVWDPDTVEDHNIPNQVAYGPSDIGKHKVDALNETILWLTGRDITTHAEPYTDQELSGVVVSAVDSMATRTVIWEQVNRFAKDIPLYIDSRMGGLTGWVQSVDFGRAGDRARYMESLYTDDEAEEEACTARAIVYNTGGIAFHICDMVRRYVKGLPIPGQVLFTVASDNPEQLATPA